MTLREAIDRADVLNVYVMGNDAAKALFAHAVAVLPAAVDALEGMENACRALMHGNTTAAERAAAYDAMTNARRVLALAREVMTE